MRILLIGSGGREHALAAALIRSPQVSALYAAPGNPGIAETAETVETDVTDGHAVTAFALEKRIDFVVIGPEAPLAAGVADALREAGIAVFGPGKAGALLESSKARMKALCVAAGVPTAEYQEFTDAEKATAYAVSRGRYPLVIKADGLAAGKGVVIAADAEEARDAVDAMMVRREFGAAGDKVVIEEFLEGREISFFALVSDGVVVPFGGAQDHKRIGDGDTGLNTGGMGAFSPPVGFTPELQEEVMSRIIRPTAERLRAEGISYRGVLFAGLMLTREGVKLLEYNVRFGDPETQALTALLESDLAVLLKKVADGTLTPADAPVFKSGASLCVVAASKGYPGAFAKGTELADLAPAEDVPGVRVFHAGTARRADGVLVASGGRVLGITACGASLSEARRAAYDALARTSASQVLYFRRDIGLSAVKAEESGI